MLRPPLFTTATLALLCDLAAAFTFSISTPIQCSNLTVNIVGGTPPYELVLVPIGEVNPEIRTIVDLNSTDTTMSFPLRFPAKSQFSVMMNDATGVGTGGTGIVQTVAASDDTSCLTGPTSTKFSFYTDSVPTVLTQCAVTNISWDPSPTSQPPITLLGLIPGGESFVLPVQPNQNFYAWTVDVRATTSVQLFVGDKRGKGTGGSVGLLVVKGGAGGCINEASPSSTAGSAAGSITDAPPAASHSASGGTSATGSPSASSSATGSPGGSTGSKSNIGAIVGGVVGGVVGLAVIAALLFFCCRRNKGDHTTHENVDLMHGEEPASASSPPMLQAGFYQPEPFVVPESSGRQSSGRQSTEQLDGTSTSHYDSSGGASSATGGRLLNRRYSAQSASESSSDPASVSLLAPRTGGGRGGGTSGSTDRKHPPSAMRATNFVQHEDSEQVVELPPTYQSVRPSGSGAGVAPPPPLAES